MKNIKDSFLQWLRRGVKQAKDQDDAINESESINTRTLNEVMKNFERNHSMLLSENKTISYHLNSKVDNFLEWYYKNMLEGVYTDLYSNYMISTLRNFIEKMAVWYEIRYSRWEVNRKLGINNYGDPYTEELLENNPYIKEMKEIMDIEDIQHLDWSDLYNTHSFINTLSHIEETFLKRPKYERRVFLDNNGNWGELYLSANGRVMRASRIDEMTHSRVRNSDLVGKNIKEVEAIFNDKCYPLSKGNEIERAIVKYDNDVYFKKQLLNCVAHRIIERGGVDFGPRRAFIFVKEFGGNIDTPMMYGATDIDGNVCEDNYKFIKEYLKSGGREELECYVRCFSIVYGFEPENKKRLSDLIRDIKEAEEAEQTKKEEEKVERDTKELRQRLVNVLASQIDEDKLSKEKVKQLRLERRLEKNKSGLK